MGSIVSRTTDRIVMSEEKVKFVRDSISKDRVVIFSKSTCPYCNMAKEQFKKLKFDVIVIELDQRNDGEELQHILKSMTGAHTVPRVFIDGKCVGGGTDVKKLYDDGSLEKMLRKATTT